jgi:hypothetical protein
MRLLCSEPDVDEQRLITNKVCSERSPSTYQMKWCIAHAGSPISSTVSIFTFFLRNLVRGRGAPALH